MKLSEFRVTFRPNGSDPDCSDAVFFASFVDDRGHLFGFEEVSEIYEGILDDPEQIPWLIAHRLRELVVKANLE